jgi:tetratricopeptide (TPR) repeat protein
MTATLDIFISSKMQELRAERQAVLETIGALDYGDIVLHAWLYEKDVPSSGRTTRDIYLTGLQNSALYIGIFWNEYGEWTEDELERATECDIERHLYVKDVDSERRDTRLKDLLGRYSRVTTGVSPKRFTTMDGLKDAVRQSITAWFSHRLQRRATGASALLARDPDDLIDRPRRLIGREALLGTIGNLLAQGERVLIRGFSGMGKTALAATAAGAWIADGKGAVLWLRAGSSNEEVILESLSRPLGTWQEILQKDGEARGSAVRRILRDSEVKLLVLDDCWNGRALCHVLRAVPSSMPVLVTARQRYAVDQMVDVNELTPTDALILLSVHAGRELTAVEADPLCRRMAFHPFSLEIAGKVLRAQNLTASELLSRIADAPHDLTVPGNFSLKERSSVKELLDASVSVLKEDSRKVFFGFGAFFAPQVTVEMLTLYLHGMVVWGDKALSLPFLVNDDPRNQQSVRNALNALEIQGLAQRLSSISREAKRYVITISSNTTEQKEQTDQVEYYRIHDLSFSYACAQVDDEKRKKALDICLAYTFFHSEPGPETYRSLSTERDNLLGAAAFALSHGYHDHVQRFATNLFYVSAYFERSGSYGDGVRLLEQAAEAAKRGGDTEGYYRHLGNIGKAYLGLRQNERALQYTTESLRLAREAGDEEVEQLMLMNQGAIYLQANDVRQAYQILQAALVVAKKRGDRRGVAMLFGNLGVLLERIGQYDEAYDMYKSAVEVGDELKDYEVVSKGLANLGGLFFKEKQYDKAEQVYKNSLQILRQLGDRANEATVWQSLGFVYQDAGYAAFAIEAWRMAQSLFLEMGKEDIASAFTRLIAKIEGQ